MLILNVDKDSAVPAYQQICQRVIGLVQTAALGPGDRLPPTRELARTIGVHRSTVIRAYGELWALGYLESRPGSYSTARRPARAAATGQSAGQSFIDWDTIATPSARPVEDPDLCHLAFIVGAVEKDCQDIGCVHKPGAGQTDRVNDERLAVGIEEDTVDRRIRTQGDHLPGAE